MRNSSFRSTSKSFGRSHLVIPMQDAANLADILCIALIHLSDSDYIDTAEVYRQLFEYHAHKEAFLVCANSQVGQDIDDLLRRRELVA